jgi:tetratricopeptide (TPR) repeat protein
MKNIIILPILLLSYFSTFCQLKFENLSFDEALQQSKETGKLIFLQLESDECFQCNEVTDKAFSDVKLGNLLAETFICIKLNKNHPDRQKVAALFNKTSTSIGSLFIAGDGSLIHTYTRTTTSPKAYEEEVNKALSKAGEGIRLKNMEQEYNSGNRSIGFLELYMKMMKNFQLNTTKLLDEYVSLLNNDSLKSMRTFSFVVSMVPILESSAYEKLNLFYEALNKKNYNSNYPLHPSIKNQIAYKSLKKAILEKDEQYAIRTALFAKKIYLTEPEKASKTYESYLLDYYIGINDTMRYLQQASNYYDRYYMSLSADSIKKRDTLNMNELAKKQTPTMEKKGDSVVMRKQILYSSVAQSLSNNLSEAGRKFMEFTTDNTYLAKALKWSEKALELYENYTTLNVYALLLYKTGNKKEAVNWQEKAILFKKKRGFDTKSLEQELNDMK